MRKCRTSLRGPFGQIPRIRARDFSLNIKRGTLLGVKLIVVATYVSALYSEVSKSAHDDQCNIPIHRPFNLFIPADPLVDRTDLKSWRLNSENCHSSVTHYEAYTKSAGPWFEHTNVCVDHVDRIKYFEDDDASYERNATLFGACKAGIPHRPIPFPWKGESRRNELIENIVEYGENSPVYVLKGKTLLFHCWRVPNNPHPLHFLFGYGAVLSVLFAPVSEFKTVDHVVFHQCPTPDQGGDFHEVIWDILLKEAFAKRLFDSGTRLYTTTLQRLLCMENVRDNGWMDKQPYRPGPFSEGPPYMGADAHTFQVWEPRLIEYLEKCRPRANAALDTLSPYQHYDRSPRVAVFQRHGDSRNGLRRFVNLLEVQSLVREYTKNVEVITVSAETKLEEIISTFNSFDVLITPHGSQIVNLLFSIKTTKMAVVEVVGSCQHFQLSLWFGQRMIDYRISAGHRSPDSETQASIAFCEAHRNTTPCGPICADQSNCQINETKCNSLQLNGPILSTDLIVVIEKLRSDLERAIQYVLK